MSHQGIPEEWDLREYMKDREPADRKCSQCRDVFKSKSKANRICPACTALRPSEPGKVASSRGSRKQDFVYKG